MSPASRAPLSKLSLPEEGWEKSGTRVRFLNAGIRSASAPVTYFGAKTLLALVFPILTYIGLSFGTEKIEFNSLLMFMLLMAAIGYYLPNVILSRLVFVRQREIFENFPDALDLMVVCVEAGLGIDAALNRVADDMGAQERGTERGIATGRTGVARRRRSGASFAQSGGADRCRGSGNLGCDADSSGSLWHQYRLDPPSSLRDVTHQATSARRGSSGENRVETAVPPDFLYFPLADAGVAWPGVHPDLPHFAPYNGRRWAMKSLHKHGASASRLFSLSVVIALSGGAGTLFSGCQTPPTKQAATKPWQIDPIMRVGGTQAKGSQTGDSHYQLGRYYDGQLRPDQAIEAYRKAILLDPQHAEAHNALGVSLARKGKLTDAIALLERAASLASNKPHIVGNLGYALLLAGRNQSAITMLTSASRPGSYRQPGS